MENSMTANDDDDDDDAVDYKEIYWFVVTQLIIKWKLKDITTEKWSQKAEIIVLGSDAYLQRFFLAPNERSNILEVKSACNII